MSRQQITHSISLLFVAIMVSGMVSSCALLPTGRSDRAASEAPTPTPIPTAIVPTKPTYKVAKGEVVDELTFSGRISPVLEKELFFRTDGRVRTVFSKRNEMIKKGTVIAELENDALERDLKAAELELERAQVTLDAAKRELEFNLRAAKDNLEIEQIKLASLQAAQSPDANAIAIQQKQIDLSQISVDRLDRGVDPLVVNDLTRNQLAVEKLKTQIAEAEITAPFDGQLLSVSLSPGQEVKGYQAVVVLADVNNLEVSADLLSDQMTKLVESMPATQVALMYECANFDYWYDEGAKWFAFPFPQGMRGLREQDLGMRKVKESENGAGHVIALLLLPALQKVYEAHYRLQRRIEGLRCVEAVRMYAALHGKLPDALEDIKDVPIPEDPMTGRPFLYEKEGDTANLSFTRAPGYHLPPSKYVISLPK